MVGLYKQTCLSHSSGLVIIRENPGHPVSLLYASSKHRSESFTLKPGQRLEFAVVESSRHQLLKRHHSVGNSAAVGMAEEELSSLEIVDIGGN